MDWICSISSMAFLCCFDYFSNNIELGVFGLDESSEEMWSGLWIVFPSDPTYSSSYFTKESDLFTFRFDFVGFKVYWFEEKRWCLFVHSKRNFLYNVQSNGFVFHLEISFSFSGHSKSLKKWINKKQQKTTKNNKKQQQQQNRNNE